MFRTRRIRHPYGSIVLRQVSDTAIILLALCDQFWSNGIIDAAVEKLSETTTVKVE